MSYEEDAELLSLAEPYCDRCGETGFIEAAEGEYVECPDCG